MIIRHIILTVLFFNTVLLSGQYSKSEDVYYSRLEGEADSSIIITANIIRLSENINGTYSYVTKADGLKKLHSNSIPLTGSVKNDTAHISELGKKDNLLIGEIKRKSFSGYWNFNDHTEYPISMAESYPEGSIPFDVYYLHSEEKLFMDSVDTPTAEIELTLVFPVKINENSQIIDSVKKHITDSFFGNDTFDLDPDSMLTHFESEYYGNYKDQNIDRYNSGASFNWQRILSMTVLNNSNELLCLEYLKYAYAGGAHGMTNISFNNIDLNTGMIYLYEDLFKDGSDSLLSVELTRELYLDRQIPHDIDLKEAGYFVDMVGPNHNFFINNNGIGFLYNSYEIAPYSMGQTTIFIEFDKIINLLKEDTSIYDLAKNKAL